LGTLVRKVAEWARENLRPERRTIVADLHDAVSAVVGRLLVPLAMQDGEVRNEALELARSLGSGGECPLVCAPVDLIDEHREADAVQERITTALHTMNGTEDTMTAPGEAVLLWLAYADKGFVEAAPERVLAEVVTVLSSVRRPGLNAALDIMAAVVKDFPARLDSRSLGVVLRTLDYLVRATALPPRSPAMDEDLETVEELALLRAAAARFAFRIFQYHASRSLPVPPVLERWREICASDLLPEVRREWAA
jgi:hypothetical protein